VIDLLRGLPDDAALRRGSVQERQAREQRKEWDVRTELLAVIADRTGVAASAQEYKEPPKPIERPAWLRDDAPQAQPVRAEGSGVKRAISVLANSARRVLS
jgi:hypothetical protein